MAHRKWAAQSNFLRTLWLMRSEMLSTLTQTNKKNDQKIHYDKNKKSQPKKKQKHQITHLKNRTPACFAINAHFEPRNEWNISSI